MKRILLVGHAGFSNRGCEAIVRGTVAAIRHHMPDAVMTLASREATTDAASCSRSGIAVSRVIDAYGTDRCPSPRWILQTLHRRILYPRTPHYDYVLRNAYATHDAVLSIGGDNFTDDYGHAGACFTSLVHAGKAGANTAIWAASIGPFRNPEEEREWTGILKSTDLITVREVLAREYLASIGVVENVHHVADPAFLMKPQRPANAPERPAGLIVGVNVSDLCASSTKHGDLYVQSTAAFVRALVHDHAAQVRLVPHVVVGGKGTDDEKACAAVAAATGVGTTVQTISADLNAAELKFVIGECDYFVGARTHSTIASLSMAVPTISLAYSPKAFGINREIFDSDEYVIPFADASADVLMARFMHMVSKSDAIRKTLSTQVPILCERALEGGLRLCNLLHVFESPNNK